MIMKESLYSKCHMSLEEPSKCSFSDIIFPPLFGYMLMMQVIRRGKNVMFKIHDHAKEKNHLTSVRVIIM